MEGESSLERVLVERQHPWPHVSLFGVIPAVVIEAIRDAVPRDAFHGGDVGERLVAGPLEQSLTQPVGDAPPTGYGRVSFPTGSPAVAALEASLGPQQHGRIGAHPIPDAPDRSTVADHGEGATVMTGPFLSGTDRHLEHAGDELRARTSNPSSSMGTLIRSAKGASLLQV